MQGTCRVPLAQRRGASTTVRGWERSMCSYECLQIFAAEHAQPKAQDPRPAPPPHGAPGDVTDMSLEQPQKVFLVLLQPMHTPLKASSCCLAPAPRTLGCGHLHARSGSGASDPLSLRCGLVAFVIPHSHSRPVCRQTTQASYLDPFALASCARRLVTWRRYFFMSDTNVVHDAHCHSGTETKTTCEWLPHIPSGKGSLPRTPR